MVKFLFSVSYFWTSGRLSFLTRIAGSVTVIITVVPAVADSSNNCGSWTTQHMTTISKIKNKTKGPKMVRWGSFTVLQWTRPHTVSQLVGVRLWGREMGQVFWTPKDENRICPMSRKQACECRSVAGALGCRAGDLLWTQDAHLGILIASCPACVDNIPESGGWTSVGSRGRQVRVHIALGDLGSPPCFTGRI